MSIAVTTLLSVNPAVGATLTDGTEQALVTGTAAGIFELNVDLSTANSSAIQGTDFFELRAYKKINNTTKVAVKFATVTGGGTILFGPVPTATYIEFSIKRVGGTDRTIKWSVENYEGA